ncbi:hypothetical protein FisN_20Hh007 [Fistulifera solaris]|uniref:Uncharacterized protein n=1 Tax=Fistulifera solaris TaxID=1519565 RepID=A0A1Z5KC34_FISSO|nr:hypothetical protein FisN_20Hh007 [Fistulifera solaris]|eukprot:GAX23807.1 hypothetical protein FisN_20Hh007 [Fistulifera solaris]
MRIILLYFTWIFPLYHCFVIRSNSYDFRQQTPLIVTTSATSPCRRLSMTSSSVTTAKKQRPRRKPAAKNGKSTTTNKQLKTWRVFGVEVHPDRLADIQIDHRKSTPDIPLAVSQQYVNDAVLESLLMKFSKKNVSNSTSTADTSPAVLLEQMGIDNVRVVRRSLDARDKRRVDGGHGPRFVYVLDFDVLPGSKLQLKEQLGRMECLTSKTNDAKLTSHNQASSSSSDLSKKRVIIVGAGPAGLFCALQLARAGVHVTVLERGQPVESRGKDIGALIHRRSLDAESNFCLGEGGAGTWSDGKLTTRIGRNSDAVRLVLETFVEYGAPEKILVEGAPHLGTDNLVRLLRNMRLDLRRLGADIRFGTKVTKLVVEDETTKGVEFVTQEATERSVDGKAVTSNGGEHGQFFGDAVVLATGHSARDIYEQLHASGVKLEPKGFAVGFRIEHPQTVINEIQYGQEWGPTVVTGKKITDEVNQKYFDKTFPPSHERISHQGNLPVPSYQLATDEGFDGIQERGVYSFCMCPGGQIIAASTDPDELCVNGMSFSRRDSIWANSALVVTVASNDTILDPYREEHGVLAGVAFQRDMERRASVMGGGNLTVPVQRVTDFLAGRPSTSAPSSSYRLGVKPAACHEIYPQPLVSALRYALTQHFEKNMPGYICEDALLHAVETRTSSPVRISRDDETLQAIGTEGLFPVGEGAGFAGGIVSAAVDGLVVATALQTKLSGA